MLVAHADWGVDRRKRWVAVARGDVGRGWTAAAARPFPLLDRLRDSVGASVGEQVLIGFDFPIGLPRAFAQRAHIERFVDALPLFGSGDWASFFDVADDAVDISLHRPFYPRAARVKGAKRQVHLTDALGLSMVELRRRCEQRQPERSAACSLFWTVGGNQVGKGALAGWRMLQDQPRATVQMWPFDGSLTDLMGSSETIVAETYPAEFYGHLGLPRVVGKRKQASRVAQSDRLHRAAERLGVRLDGALVEQLETGFGRHGGGEDAFDAVVGMLGMINVLEGHRPSGEPDDDPAIRAVEGWILGQRAVPT
jgi:hypothetical protein